MHLGVKLLSAFMENYFRVRTPEVTSENFKNEVLIIDLKTGHYHSLRGAAARIWQLLDAGQSLEASIDRLQKSYTAPAETVEADTRQFVAELAGMGLIMPIQEGVSKSLEMDGDHTEYTKPTIDSYGDLQDLLLLDPIHEIAPESGWPHRLEDA